MRACTPACLGREALHFDRAPSRPSRWPSIPDGRSAGQALRQLGQPAVAIQRRVIGLEGHQPWFAFGQRAGLVYRHGAQAARLFEEHAALDQDAAPPPARPLTTVTGVEITSAQGQAMTSSTSAL